MHHGYDGPVTAGRFEFLVYPDTSIRMQVAVANDYMPGGSAAHAAGMRDRRRWRASETVTHL